MRSCEILFNKVKAGILTECEDGSYRFEYLPEYLALDDAEAISLTLPLSSNPYHSPFLFATFYNMLSEGENRQLQSEFLHIDKDDDFGIMLETCTYDTIGAITVNPLNK